MWLLKLMVASAADENNILNINGNYISITMNTVLGVMLLSICTWNLQIMSLVSVMLFSNCTCFGYTVITGNYSAHTNFISTKFYGAPKSTSILKLSPFIVRGKFKKCCFVPWCSSYCIYNLQVFSVMAVTVTSFLAYCGNFGKFTPYHNIYIYSTWHVSNSCLYNCHFLLFTFMAFARHLASWGWYYCYCLQLDCIGLGAKMGYTVVPHAYGIVKTTDHQPPVQS